MPVINAKQFQKAADRLGQRLFGRSKLVSVTVSEGLDSEDEPVFRVLFVLKDEAAFDVEKVGQAGSALRRWLEENGSYQNVLTRFLTRQEAKELALA